MKLGSRLRAADACAGRNFVSDAVHMLVRRELALREEGAAIDEERLFGNALSSMPLAFNLFGPMALDPKGLATSVFRSLLPDFVAEVTGIRFETSPGRRDRRFLDDSTAFDVSADVVTPDGVIATVYIELKYSESMTGPAACPKPRYDEVSREVRLFRDPDSPALRSLALEQLWREHMLAQLAVDRGLTSQARFVAIGPQLNRQVMASFASYTAELANPSLKDDVDRVSFEALTLETVVQAVIDAGANDLGERLWKRYLDFGRVLEVALAHSEPPPTNTPVTAISAPARLTTNDRVGLMRANTSRVRAEERRLRRKAKPSVEHDDQAA